MAIKNTIASTGKHRADPIDANFLNGIVTPLGKRALEDLVAKTHLLRKGTDLSIWFTRQQDTLSLASDKSIVAKVPRSDPM
jgi:hypothetical protein